VEDSKVVCSHFF